LQVMVARLTQRPVIQPSPSDVSGQTGAGDKPIRLGDAGPSAARMAELVGRIAAGGDRAAFKELYEMLAPRLRVMLMRQGAPRANADEIVQESFLTLWRKASVYAPDRGSVPAWLFVIARNLRISQLRREAPSQALAADYSEMPDPDPRQDEMLASRQLHGIVQTAISELPPDQREVVRLAYLEGISHGDIAKRLGLPLGTVKSRMRLAYGKIRASLEDAS